MSCPMSGVSRPSAAPCGHCPRRIALVAVGVAAVVGLAYYLYHRVSRTYNPSQGENLQYDNCGGSSGETFDGCCSQPMKLKKRRKMKKTVNKGAISSGSTTDGSVISDGTPEAVAVKIPKRGGDTTEESEKAKKQ